MSEERKPSKATLMMAGIGVVLTSVSVVFLIAIAMATSPVLGFYLLLCLGGMCLVFAGVL